MRKLKQAIAVGQYPAPCFDAPGEPKEKQHRRFLRRLAQQGVIRMVDAPMGLAYALLPKRQCRGRLDPKPQATAH